MEIVLWIAVGLYVTIASYTAAETLSCKHVYTRTWGARALIALESVAWPVMLLPWRELPSALRQTWNALPTRYSEVAA